MVSTAKKLKVKGSISSSSKEDLAVALGDILLERKFVKIHTKDLADVDRESVEKVEVF